MKLLRRGTRGWPISRAAATVGMGLAIVSAMCAVVGAGVLPDLGNTTPSAMHVAVITLLVATLGFAIIERLRFSAPSARAQQASGLARFASDFADIQISLALTACTYGILALTGGARSPAQPLIYLLVAFSATFQVWRATLVIVAVCLYLELAAATGGGTSESWQLAGSHATFIVFSALLHTTFLRGLIWRQRRQHQRTLTEAVRSLRDEAREFRLIASTLGVESRAPRSREEEEGKLAEGAVETIHASMFYTLELLKKSLDLQTCILLWLDESGERLKIKELVTDSDRVIETAIAADSGAIGVIVRDRLLLNLRHPKHGHVSYYARPEDVAAFLGVPVLENGHLRGVLCADRSADLPFSDREETLLKGAVEHILRAIQSERVFAAVERSKYEHERFYHASAMLGRALTLDRVMDTAIAAVAEIVEFDLAAITLFSREEKKHRVCRVRVGKDGDGMVDVAALEELEFRDNSSLIAMAVKNKHFLPAGGELRDQETPLFTRRIKLRGVESLLVLPLICADEAIGTLTLAAKRRLAFGKDTRNMLGVIANQVAVSLENAKMYRQMERMATTDGLTGLVNHRTFQERLVDLLGRSERHGLKLAVILTDVDHFKKVNDTYGHPVGDQVLRGVARILENSARKIDVVARYGGEEFVIVMEGTDPEGALRLAERIREEVAEMPFQVEGGTLHVTLSLGIAGVPEDARDKDTILVRADQALYHAKHTGRNRSVTYREFVAARSSRRVAQGTLPPSINEGARDER